ncbi:MAG: sulfatase [Roseibacillus sp.]|nr:sulfatase [Roseibacillus sp.]
MRVLPAVLSLLLSLPFLSPAAPRPNILFLLVDDLRHDTFGFAGHKICQTPHLDALAAESHVFQNAFVTTAICMVSRASIFTGQYEARHQIHDFRTEFSPAAWGKAYPQLLKEAGYHTGFVGKYGVGNKMTEARKTFNFWRGFAGQGRFLDPRRKDNQHLTALQGDQSLEFLRTAPKDKPWCLSVSFKAVHCQDGAKRQFPPDKRDEKMFADVTIPPAPLSDPAIFQALHEPLRTSESRRRWEIRFSPKLFQETVKDYYRLLFGVDREVGRMREELKKLGVAENTVIIFTSDHGFYLGERGLAGKWFAHEESIRIPLIIHDPRNRKKRAQPLTELVLNIDFAPTILSCAGLNAPESMQGRSLTPLLAKTTGDWRSDFFYEHHFIPNRIPESEAVRGQRWKYIHWLAPKAGVEELYDLSRDPLERNNLAGDASHRETLATMRKRWKELKAEAR